jgi:hypothetical protein
MPVSGPQYQSRGRECGATHSCSRETPETVQSWFGIQMAEYNLCLL